MGVLLGRKMANELGENGKMNGKYGKMGMDGGFEVFFEMADGHGGTMMRKRR